MSMERPSDHTRIPKIAGSLEGKLSSLHLSRAPTGTPLSIDMDSNSDNGTNILQPSMAPVVGVNHAPTTVFATTEASTESPPISVPVTSLIPAVPKQLGSTPEPETSPTHMSVVSRSPSSRDSIMQAATAFERNPSDSGSFFANAQNILINGGTFITHVHPVNTGVHPVNTGVHPVNTGVHPVNTGVHPVNTGVHPVNTGVRPVNTGVHPVNTGVRPVNTGVRPVNTGKGQMKTPVIRKPHYLFVGQRDVLDKLGKIFAHGPDSKLTLRHSCLLWGTGGVGKTEICLKFTEEISDRLSYVFWVDASSLESIVMSLKGISCIPAAHVSCLDDSVESALQWISGIQEEWLMVFDNADDLCPDVVAKFFPPGDRGNLLITSRNPSMGRLIAFENVIEINEMEEADAILLLLHASCLDASAEHIKVAQNIVTELGCMPLAVDQAGGYIETENCSVDKYLQHFSLHCHSLLLDATFRGASNYDRTVYGTWDLSFKEIERRAGGQSSSRKAQGAKAAILILRICAFYHHSNISEDIFQSAAEKSGKYTYALNSLDCALLALDNDGYWNEGMGVLLSFSLIKIDCTLKMLSVHPLIHCWSRQRMPKAEQQRMYDIGTIILSCSIPWGMTSYDNRLRQLIFPHIKANELHGSEMGLTKHYHDDQWNNFIYMMEEIQDWNNAEQLGKLFGAEHLDTLKSMENLARIYNCQRKLNEAEHLQVQVLDMRRKLLGVEHVDTLHGMEYLARTYCDQRKFKEAKHLQVQVLDMRKKLLGVEHVDTLRGMEYLARTYCDQRNFNKAMHLQVQVLDMRKRLLGVEHVDTLCSMEYLARTYCDQRKFNEAEHLQVQVLDMRKKLLGVDHLDTLCGMEYLAWTYYGQRKLNEAEHLQVQVLDMRKKLLGVEHLDTLCGMEYLAKTYCDQKKLNEAEHLQVQVLDMRKKLLGVEHLDTLHSMEDLARTYYDQRKLNEAEQLEVQVVDMRKKLLSADSSEKHILTW